MSSRDRLTLPDLHPHQERINELTDRRIDLVREQTALDALPDEWSEEQADRWEELEEEICLIDQALNAIWEDNDA